MAASSHPLVTLTQRADFLRAARMRRQSCPGFTLQARHRGPEEVQPQALRVGYTCSKKVGNAVARNRAKRRLRALARAVIAAEGCPGWDYVLIGRADETARRNFAQMAAELEAALARIHAPKSAPRNAPRSETRPPKPADTPAP